MKKKLFLSLLTGGIFSFFALGFSFKNIPIESVIKYFHTIDYVWFIPAVAVALLSFLIRVFRWQIILRSTGDSAAFRLVFHTLMTGLMLNCVLPGRIGEVARPIILKNQSNTPFSTGLATVIAERAFDITALITLFVILLSMVTIDPMLVVTFGGFEISADTISMVFSGIVKFSIVLVSGIVALSISRVRNFIISTILKSHTICFFLKKEQRTQLTTKILLPLTRFIESFASGFSLMKDPVKISITLLLSFTVWSVQAYSYYLMSLGCPGIDLSFIQIATVMVIICFAISLPSVPGFWGLWEAGGIFALAVFSVARDNAAGYTLINHVVQVVPIMIAGAISALIIGININQLYNKRIE